LKIYRTKRIALKNQYLIGILIITFIALSASFLLDYTGYRVVALILLLAVSILAMLFDILPVLFTALSSALIWNFFFIPPIFNFHVGTPEDVLMFLMYFVVALINAVLTFKIREIEKKTSDEESREKTIMLYNTLLNSLSHELRTPISAIIGSIDAIKDQESNISDTNKNELYSEIEIAALRLNRQVENLLSMGKLEAGILKPNPDWNDMNEVIFSTLKNNKEEAANHTVAFEADENLPLFKIDRGMVEQVLQNLLRNALKHTPESTVVKIKVVNEGENCLITVSDNGPGFPDEEVDLVFDNFFRLANSRTGGTGLGLSIVKGFTEALGGNVRLENLDEGGAIFTVRIPAETSSTHNLEQ
jgi:two-component system sensor histidine kinase KdpD